MKALIFGASGQDGILLTELLKKNQIDVEGFSRSHGLLRGDVANFHFVKKIIQDLKPDYIFHFAANSVTSHDALFENHEAISTGTLNILESAREHSPHAKIFISGSAMQFKNDGLPINEQTSFEAKSPYAIARIQSSYASRYFRECFGMKIYNGYLFNHDSHLRSSKHLNQKIISFVKKVKYGTDQVLDIGDIEVKKEFNYAGDIVEAIWTLMKQDNIFEVVIGSGQAYAIKDWIAYCFNIIGKDWKQYININADYMPEYKILVSDPTLIKSLGWFPNTDFHELANIMTANFIDEI
jgi:GDPmannose 4,6-dehydratase